MWLKPYNTNDKKTKKIKNTPRTKNTLKLKYNEDNLWDEFGDRVKDQNKYHNALCRT